jgi:hypothetical protein
VLCFYFYMRLRLLSLFVVACIQRGCWRLDKEDAVLQ